ncbi:hypothetical protein V5O48_004089 [Marasmius crinis-equi]|uniref:Uncharacterized protein n=1 Tax=Marasmius crinis-equi TaxID=585013 RepID=A0ABR3FR24_9AGAR
MSTSSSSPTSTPSRDSRRRKHHPQGSQRKTLVRNSSLFGSIKNFVAAPFSRLFTGSTEEFDDERDFSGKRRRAAPQSRDDFETVEDGPAPPKRLRVASPSLSPPPSNRGSNGGYLDPPSSAFRQNSPYYNKPSRSASITIPSTTLSDSNTRSTISPLRHQLSTGMKIDPRPMANTYNRNTSRDSPMASVPLAGATDRNVPHVQPNERPRDLSMPPLSGRPSFIMRSSMTPQPQRDVSEPPPMTSLGSYPVFVRPPTQVNEQRQKSATPTLGSLVDSQRQAQGSQTGPSARQRSSMLFGRQGQESQQSNMLQELDFYRTPLVPTRQRAKALRNGGHATDITDMFSRKQSLVLMGDDNRPKLGRRGLKKEKETENNESKPYAGTTGLKKRLAKHKQDEEEVLRKSHDGDASLDDSMMSDKPSAAEEKAREIPQPQPPPAGKDFFSLATSSATSSAPQTSSLRVGRASRSHISRPSRPSKPNFSAAFDEDEDVSEESRKELAALEEAAKKVPVFQVPAGFSFAKDVRDNSFYPINLTEGDLLYFQTKPVEVDSTNAKEPPVSSLPFSLTSSASGTGTKTSEPSSIPPMSAAEPPRPASPPRNVPEMSFKPSTANVPSTSTPEPNSDGKVPNFFASSKFLSNENTPTPSFGVASPTPNPQPGSGSASPFTLPPPSTFAAPPASHSPGLVSAAVPPKEADAPLWQKTDDGLSSSFAGTNGNAPTMFSFTPQTGNSPLGAPAVSDKQQEDASLSAPFSFGKPSADEPRPPSTGIPFSLTPSAPTAGLSTGQPGPSLLLGGPSPSSTSIFSNKTESAPSGAGSLFSTSNTVAPVASTPSSLFGAPKATEVEASKPASLTSAPSPFSFGQKSEQSSSPFTTAEKPKLDLFGQSSVAQGSAPSSSTSTSSPFSFAPTSTSDAPKPAFGFGAQGSATADTASTRPKPFSFGGGATTPPVTNEAAKPFSFGNTPAATPPAETSKPFSFGNATNSTTTSTDPAKPFPFGSATNPSGSTGSSAGFSFGGGSATPTPGAFGESKPGFSFGTSRPVTPPPNPDQEVRMEESPTRDLQKPAEPRPSLSGFGFGSSTSSPFGQPSAGQTPSGSTSSPFSFGASSNTGNGFGMKPEEAKPPFGFGQAQPNSATSTSSPFSFGAAKTDNEPPRPSTTGSFSFAPSPSTANPPFAFGASSNTTSNAFGGQQTGSAPSSPSTFSQTPAFAAAGSNPFSFGSQPASPATPSTTLPGSGFGAPAGGFGASQPSGGNTLFTMGSSSPSTANQQGRRIKGLPKRGGKR